MVIYVKLLFSEEVNYSNTHIDTLLELSVFLPQIHQLIIATAFGLVRWIGLQVDDLRLVRIVGALIVK